MYLKKNPTRMNNFEKSPTRTQPDDSDYISPIVDSLHNFGKEKIKQLINYGADKIKNEAKKELPTSVVTNFDKIYYAIGGSSGVAVFLFVCLIEYYAYKKIRIHLIQELVTIVNRTGFQIRPIQISKMVQLIRFSHHRLRVHFAGSMQRLNYENN